MAYYTPRPDGLVDVDIGGGRMLPMAEVHAQTAGVQPMPAPLSETAGMVPVANPTSAIGPEAVAGIGGGPAESLGSGAGPWGNAPPSAPTGIPALPPAAEPIGVMPRMGGTAAMHREAPPPTGAFMTPYDRPGDPPTAPAEGLIPIRPGQTPQGPPGIAQQSPGRMVQLSKGGDIRTSFVRKPGVDADPALQDYADNLDPAAEHNQALFDANRVYSQRDAAISADETANTNAQIQQQVMADRIAMNRAKLETKLAAVDKREAEAAAATPQSRNEIIQDRGTLAGMMSGLAIALGGYAQGLRGGPNAGLEIVNQSIQGEIDSQRMKYEAMKDRAAAARTAYGQALQLYGDPNAAEADLYMRGLTLAGNISQNHWKKAENTAQYNAQKQLAEQLYAAAAEKKQAIHTLLNGQVVQENYQYQAPQFGVIGGPPKLNKEQREAIKDARERKINIPGVGEGYVPAANRAKEVQDKLTSGADVVNSMQKLAALAKENTLTDYEKKARYKAIATDIAAVISVAKGQGAMGVEEFGRMQDLLGDPNAVLKDNGAAIAEAIRQQTARNQGVIRDNVYADPDATQPLGKQGGSSFRPGLD